MSTTHQRTVKDRHMVREGGGRELKQHAGIGEAWWLQLLPTPR